jgi:hypothetical protein
MKPVRAYTGAKTRRERRQAAKSGVRLALGASLLLSSIFAWAHIDTPDSAPLLGPKGVGKIVDSEYEIAWADFADPAQSSSTTVDLFYTATNPTPFFRGQLPEGLHGERIVRGIPKATPNNKYVWNTSTVAAGTYWLWSQVFEPDSDGDDLIFIEFSPGLITIAHPGDPVPPAILFTRPNLPVAIATDEYRIEYALHDPDGSGQIKIEAAPAESSEYTVLLDQTVTSSIGQYLWDTSILPAGDWKLKATISDNRGLSFVANSRYFVTISHLLFPDAGGTANPDMGMVDSGTAQADGGTQIPVQLDSGTKPSPNPSDDNCSCNTASSKNSNSISMLGLILLLIFSARCSRGIACRRQVRSRRLLPRL